MNAGFQRIARRDKKILDLFLYVITKPVSVHIWFSKKKSQNFQKLLREYHWFSLWMFPSWEVSDNFIQLSFSVNLLKVKCKHSLVGHFWIAAIISKTRTKKTKLTIFQEDLGSLPCFIIIFGKLMYLLKYIYLICIWK